MPGKKRVAAQEGVAKANWKSKSSRDNQRTSQAKAPAKAVLMGLLNTSDAHDSSAKQAATTAAAETVLATAPNDLSQLSVVSPLQVQQEKQQSEQPLQEQAMLDTTATAEEQQVYLGLEEDFLAESVPSAVQQPPSPKHEPATVDGQPSVEEDVINNLGRFLARQASVVSVATTMMDNLSDRTETEPELASNAPADTEPPAAQEHPRENAETSLQDLRVSVCPYVCDAAPRAAPHMPHAAPRCFPVASPAAVPFGRSAGHIFGRHARGPELLVAPPGGKSAGKSAGPTKK